MFCTDCLEDVKAEKVNITETFNIKGEKIQVESNYYKCSICEELMYNVENPSENIEKAYDEYRVRKNLLKPEEIKDIRDKFGVSQRQLSKLLGWSHATISKYETGALPSTNHNNTLALLRDPKNFDELLKRNRDNFSKKEYDNIKKSIDNYFEDNKNNIFLTLAETLFSQEPSEYTGYKRFNLDKIAQIVKFFALKDTRLYKLKLLKYLFYTDFLSFKRYTLSVSGLCYERFPKGPVPKEYDLLLDFVVKTGEVDKELVDFGYPNPGEQFTAIGEFDESFFNDDELEVLEAVYDKLNHHNSSTISKLSHDEDAWLKTDHLKLINYKYSSTLSLD